jgi:hypothetical protein
VQPHRGAVDLLRGRHPAAGQGDCGGRPGKAFGERRGAVGAGGKVARQQGITRADGAARLGDARVGR